MIQHDFPSADILFEFRRCELPYHAQGVGDYVILDCLADVSGANQATLSEIRSSVHVLKKSWMTVTVVDNHSSNDW